jgi:hypothetical protein
MEHAPVSPNRPWIALAVAVAMSLLMIALASGPFDAAVGNVGEGQVRVEVPLIETIAPPESVDAFPDRFEWVPVPGTVYYLVGVAEENDGVMTPLFRQQGSGPVLDVQFEAGRLPPAGSYAWEVYAFGSEGVPIAKGGGRFVVR